MYKRLAIILAFVLLALLSDRLVFTTSEAKVVLEPEVLKANPHSEMQIRVYPANMLGFKVPFRDVQVRFAVEEGAALVEIVEENVNGLLKIRSKGVEGEAIIGIYSLNSGLPVKRVLVKIFPKDLAQN